MTKLNIATWNLSGGITAEIEGDLYFDQMKQDLKNTKIKDIIETINNLNIDVLAVQEIITSPNFFIEEMCNKTQLKFFANFEQHDNHLVGNTRMGVAILSKYEIEKTECFMFENPKLTITTKSGKTYSSHDKGAIRASIKVNQTSFNIITLQGLPFHRFNSNIADYPAYYKRLEDMCLSLNNFIVLGDFNTDKFGTIFSSLKNVVVNMIDTITTIDGKKVDNIISSKDISVKNVKLHENFSDHFLITAEIYK